VRRLNELADERLTALQDMFRSVVGPTISANLTNPTFARDGGFAIGQFLLVWCGIQPHVAAAFVQAAIDLCLALDGQRFDAHPPAPGQGDPT